MDKKISLGKFIAKKRKEADLTQKELASALYVTESAVSKWERGLSYPDITLVSPLCEVLCISEHELITASEDYKQREIERQARSYRTIVKTYAWVFYLAYGVSLLACFISNLAVSHTLSWFFIVLTSEMLAFSLTMVPVLAKSHKCLLTLDSSFVSLMLLLLTCAVFSGGNWFLPVSAILLFSLSVVFLPFILRSEIFYGPVSRHRTLVCFAADTVLYFFMLTVIFSYLSDTAALFRYAVPLSLFGILYAWLLMISIRYIRLNGFFKASICLFISAFFFAAANGFIETVINSVPFRFPLFNLLVWNEIFINGNIIFLVLAVSVLLAVVFAVGGIVSSLRQKAKSL